MLEGLSGFCTPVRVLRSVGFMVEVLGFRHLFGCRDLGPSVFRIRGFKPCLSVFWAWRLQGFRFGVPCSGLGFCGWGLKVLHPPSTAWQYLDCTA